jgi:LEA14-like dessication related protein
MHMIHIYKVYTAISLAIVLLVTGCSAEPAGLARQFNLEMPLVKGVNYSLVSAAPDRFVADLTLSIYNPNGVTVGLSGLNCDALVNGIKAANITQTEPIVLTARQNSTLKLRAEVQGSQLWPCMAGHIARGESSTLSLKGTAYIGYGWLSFPYAFTYDRNLKTDLLNYKKLEGERPLPLQGLAVTGLVSRWGTVAADSLQVIHDVMVTNHGKDTANLSTTGYDVRGNGISLAEGAIGTGGTSIRPGVNTVNVVHTIKTQNIAPWLASHLNGGEVTSLDLIFKPGSGVRTSKDNQPLDGRSFKAEIRTSLANELAQLRNN